MPAFVLLALLAAASDPQPPRFRYTFEFRSRLEARTGVGFGREPDIENPLLRTRAGLVFTPSRAIAFAVTLQDSRAPLYGRPAGAAARDTVDLQEGYVELFPNAERGFGAVAGRRMFAVGDGRVIGESNWRNTGRTYDTARVYYRLPEARVEFLLVSLVDVLPDAYNRPRLADRVWGVYNTFPRWIRSGAVDLYVLRHDRIGPGGVTAFGGRATGPLSAFRYTAEIIGETGSHAAVFAGLSRRVAIVDLSAEFKSASRDYDLLYTAVHDRFGHADLFGWRNIHNLRALARINQTQSLAWSVMYNDNWLRDRSRALYDPRGRALVAPAPGARGRHIGRELDLFVTWRRSHLQLGAGFAHLFAGRFLRTATPGVNTRYLYISQTWTQ
ncbi:MAG: alginate export family protein [Bryobacteraceae bacterium]